MLALPVLFASLFLLPAPSALAADQVVTNCSNDSELRGDPLALQSSGGTLTFTCSPTMILLTAVLPTITQNVIVDGGNKITPSGNNSSRIFVVNSGATLTVQNIVLTNGYSAGDGGAIYNNPGGILLLKHATIQNSTSGQSGGGIVTYGQLNVDDSVLAFNKGANGGAIYPRLSGAQVSVTGSILHDNQTTSTTDGWGGAVLLWDGAAIALVDTDIYNNTARHGGAVYNAFANSSMSLQDARVRDNKALAGNGGGVFFGAGSLTMLRVTISGNTATNVGGGFTYNGSNASLDRVTFSGNHSDSAGGGMYIGNASGVAILNSTFSGNSSAFGGAIDNTKSTATLTNVTIYGNSATNTGGGLNNGTNANEGITLKNTIIAGSLGGGNCYDANAQTIISADANLSDDNTCTAYFNKPRDLNGSSHNPLLGPLAYNGSAMQTHLPQTNSPVVNAGISSGAPNIDQRGVTRPQGAAYDIGAVEVCVSAPAKPNLLTPANNGKGKGPAVTLDWNDAVCATTYDIMVRLGSTSGDKAFKKKNLTASTVQTKPLTKGQTYYWQVTAVNNAGKTKSDWYKFKVK